jgi:hypothetical protein
MAGRDRITLGIALAVAVVAMIGRDYPWIAAPLMLLAIFLIVWGREPRRTEAFINQLPGGKYLRRLVEQLDSTLSPRDREHEQHIRSLLARYDPEHRASLRTLLLTRSSGSIPGPHWQQFYSDSLVDKTFAGPEGIKSDLRESVRGALDDIDRGAAA